MTTEVFAASDLHRLMFGLLYPAVLGTLFFSLLPELARILTQLAQKRTGGEEEKSARIKTVAGCLIVLHFVVDFQLTSSIPDQSYKVLGFIVDLVILFVLFLAFDALNVSRPGQLDVRRSALAVAGTYALFILWSLFTLEITREHLPLLWGAEIIGLVIFVIIAIKRNVVFLCLSLFVMSVVMAYVGSPIVSSLRAVATGCP